MEKVIFFSCMFSYWIMQITSSDVSAPGSSDLLKVQMGEDITLNCSMIDRYVVSWYHLRSEEFVLLISAEKHETDGELLINYNQNSNRLGITADRWITRVSLTISGVTESDSGLYSCGTKSHAPEMHFDKPIRLEIEGLFVTQEPKEEVEVTDGVTPTERMLMFGGVGLAVFVFFLTTVIAGGIIYHRGWQRGWKEAKHGALFS